MTTYGPKFTVLCLSCGHHNVRASQDAAALEARSHAEDRSHRVIVSRVERVEEFDCVPVPT